MEVDEECCDLDHRTQPSAWRRMLWDFQEQLASASRMWQASHNYADLMFTSDFIPCYSYFQVFFIAVDSHTKCRLAYSCNISQLHWLWYAAITCMLCSSEPQRCCLENPACGVPHAGLSSNSAGVSPVQCTNVAIHRAIYLCIISFIAKSCKSKHHTTRQMLKTNLNVKKLNTG